NSGRPRPGYTIKSFPLRYAFGESFVRDHFSVGDGRIDGLGLPHHVPDGFIVFWRVRVVFRIRKGMMHAVHDAVAVRAEVVGSLKDPGQHKEYFLRSLAHGKRPVRCVTMKKKSLKKEREIPVGDKNSKNGDHGYFRFNSKNTRPERNPLHRHKTRKSLFCDKME